MISLNFKPRKTPQIRLEYNNFRFILNQTLINMLKLNIGEKLMFKFNYKEKVAYLFKDDESDYELRSLGGQNSLRFTNKNLAIHFIDCFDLDSDNSNSKFLITEHVGNLHKIELIKEVKLVQLSFLDFC